MRLAFLLLLTGCMVRVQHPLVTIDPVVSEAQGFVEAVSGKMPEWDADAKVACYEQAEIAQVKADIAQARAMDAHFFEDVAKLHEDWNKLLALDLILQRSYVI